VSAAIIGLPSTPQVILRIELSPEVEEDARMLFLPQLVQDQYEWFE
jgi:hypothetical protein